MAVKLFIFDSVEDAVRFAQGRAVSIGIDMEPDTDKPTVAVAVSDEREEPKPRRKKRTAAKEAFKGRILEKAKSKKQDAPKVGRKCGKCGGIGHRADHCPNEGLKVKDVERFDSHEEDEE